MHPILEILSQGEEIITGQTVDTNSAWLAHQSVELGFHVSRHTAVGDNLTDLIKVLTEISQRAACCICTGGLGPTCDDLTTEAVAQAFGLPLLFDEEAFNQITHFYALRNRRMPESNRKQAMLPTSSERLDNEWGTAPGFAVHANQCWFIFLPGVPTEMRNIFLAHVKAKLVNRFPLQVKTLVTLRTFGIGESEIQQRLHAIQLPDNIQLGFRAAPNEVQVKLVFPADSLPEYIYAHVALYTQELAEFIFAIDGLGKETGDLFETIDACMTQKNLSMAVIETFSQGLIASFCGRGNWLLDAQYHHSIKNLCTKLNVTFQMDNICLLAQELVLAFKVHTDADIILIQLVAGTAEQKRDKHQLLDVHTMLQVQGHFYHHHKALAGDFKNKQHHAACLALDWLRRHI
ncbi:MAG: competence/damage-inducible protein A [Methylovulum sp.]|jgi:competence/damage-inducible protein CinA-like protein|nr:competence/damage-inducible protein A [Methylovulum sp.]